MQTRPFEIDYTPDAIYIYSSSKEFLLNKASSLASYTQNTYPPKKGLEYKPDATDHNSLIETTEDETFRYRLCINPLLPSLVLTILLLTQDHQGYAKYVDNYTRESALGMITGINPCLYHNGFLKDGYLQSNYKQLTAGDYIGFSVPDKISTQGFVFIDDDLCFSLAVCDSHKKNLYSHRIEGDAIGVIRLCRIDDVLKEQKLNLSTIKSNDKAFVFYKKNPEITLPTVFINSIEQFFKLQSSFRTDLFTSYKYEKSRNNPFFKLLETINHIDMRGLHPIACEIIRENYMAIRRGYPTLNNHITKTETCFYAVLDCNPEDSAEKIATNYRRLSLKYHPDKNPDCDTTKTYQRIVSAYETLSDDDRRLQYDIDHKFKKAPDPAAEAPSASVFSLSYFLKSMLFDSSEENSKNKADAKEAGTLLTYKTHK